MWCPPSQSLYINMAQTRQWYSNIYYLRVTWVITKQTCKHRVWSIETQETSCLLFYRSIRNEVATWQSTLFTWLNVWIFITSHLKVTLQQGGVNDLSTLFGRRRGSWPLHDARWLRHVGRRVFGHQVHSLLCEILNQGCKSLLELGSHQLRWGAWIFYFVSIVTREQIWEQSYDLGRICICVDLYHVD